MPRWGFFLSFVRSFEQAKELVSKRETKGREAEREDDGYLFSLTKEFERANEPFEGLLVV